MHDFTIAVQPLMLWPDSPSNAFTDVLTTACKRFVGSKHTVSLGILLNSCRITSHWQWRRS